MRLDPEDRDWLDGKFSDVHKRITDSQTECMERIAGVQGALGAHCAASCPGAHPAAPCGDVKAHEAGSPVHDTKWAIGIFIAIVAAASGVAAIIVSAFR